MEPVIDIRKFEIFADGLDHSEALAFDADQNLWAGGELGQASRRPKRPAFVSLICRRK